MQWPELVRDALLLIVGVLGTAIWFFWRRRAEQAPVFENIQKAEKLLSLRKALDQANYTLEDLKTLEETLMGRAEAAKVLSASYEEEARKIRELEATGSLTQAEMNRVAICAHERAEDKLESMIRDMKQFYSPEESKQFDKANEAWRNYQRTNAAFMASRFEGGSIQPLIFASTLESAAVARIVELEAELQFMKEAVVPCRERVDF